MSNSQINVKVILLHLRFSNKIARVFLILTSSFILISNNGFSQNTGFILIKSNPSGAEVFINGKSTGKTTVFQKQLEAGDYKFTLKYDKYHNFEGEFTIQKDQTVIKDAVLKPAYGSIIVTSDPSGADIILDGAALDKKTPVTIKNLSSGLHNLVLSKEMYFDKKDTVTVKDELTTEVYRELEADYGIVGIVTKPENIISIDGRDTCCGSNVSKLRPGKHQIVVKRDKYYPQYQEIIVNKGQEQKLNIQLNPIIGSLSVMVDPPETAIYLNDKYYGMSPKTIDSLAIGEYNLELKKEGFGIFRQHLIIEENKTVQINKILYQGKLINIKSTPDSAEVYYNGSVIGITPTEFVVKDGLNKLILKKKYFADKEISITAERNDQDFIFNLEVARTSVNVSIETKPNQAAIKLNEKAFLPQFSSDSTSKLIAYFGTSPYNFQIPIGKYDLKVEKNGFKSIEKEILIEKQEDYNLNLEPIKYRKKGNAILLSIIWPGAGQSYLKRGSATFLMGFVAYGLAAYAIINNVEAVKNYDLYIASGIAKDRASLESKWKKNRDLYHYSKYAGIAVWGINFIWTAAMKSEKTRFRNVQFSLLNSSTGIVPIVGWRSEF